MDHCQKLEYNEFRRQSEGRHANGPAQRHQTRNGKLPRTVQTTMQVSLENNHRTVGSGL